MVSMLRLYDSFDYSNFSLSIMTCDLVISVIFSQYIYRIEGVSMGAEILVSDLYELTLVFDC